MSLSSFDSVSSTKFSGAQVAEYCKALSKSSSCILLATDSIESSLVAFDQMFRRLFESTSKKITFLLIGESTIPKEQIASQIVNYLVDNEIIVRGQVGYIVIRQGHRRNCECRRDL